MPACSGSAPQSPRHREKDTRDAASRAKRTCPTGPWSADPRMLEGALPGLAPTDPWDSHVCPGILAFSIIGESWHRWAGGKPFSGGQCSHQEKAGVFVFSNVLCPTYASCLDGDVAASPHVPQRADQISSSSGTSLFKACWEMRAGHSFAAAYSCHKPSPAKMWRRVGRRPCVPAAFWEVLRTARAGPQASAVQDFRGHHCGWRGHC